MDRTLDLVNEIWDGDYVIFAAGEEAPSRAEVEAFGRERGIPFPGDYITHSTGRMGGLYIEVKDEIWKKPELYAVGPFWSFLYGLLTFAYGNNAPEWMQILPATQEFESMGHQVIPVLKACGDADLYCYDSAGQLVQYSHEEDRFEPVGLSFFDLLGRELKELDERKGKKKSGE